MKIDFKYKSDYLFNIIAFLFFCLFIVLVFLIIKYTSKMYLKVFFIIVTGLVLFVWMYLTNRRLCIFNGSFVIDKNYFVYDTLRKSYEIKFSEVDYIAKEKCLDSTSFLNIETYLYRIKIKGAGSFVYYYADPSLDDAIIKLARKLDMEIIDKAN